MARPKRNNADYFSHDADMRNDPKIKALRRKYGFMGYALWSYLLEVLTDSDYFMHDWSDLSIELLAGDFDCEPSDLKDVVNYCIQLGLLEIVDNSFLRCNRLIERFDSLLSKRKRDRNGVIDDENPKVSVVIDDENPQSKVKESKVKKRKGEERKEEINNEDLVESFTNPYTPSEVLNLPIVLDKSGNKLTLLSSTLEQRYKNLHSARLVKEFFDYAVYSIRDKIAATEFADQRHYENWFIKLAPDERSISGKTKVVV